MFQARVRVIYGDTDQMGVVYYGNYLRYFEASRGAFIRARGRSYGDFEALGFALPVVEAHVRYKKPARYDDLIHVEATVLEVRGASLKFGYRVVRGGEELADGWTVHACLDRRGRPTRMPDDMRELLRADEGNGAS
jgi:acyl-CoA thioester hydrolase